MGSYCGAPENNISKWKHVGDTTMIGRGVGVPTMIGMGVFDSILIQQGQRQSFYITTRGPWLRVTKGRNDGEEIYTSYRNEDDTSFYIGAWK